MQRKYFNIQISTEHDWSQVEVECAEGKKTDCDSHMKEILISIERRFRDDKKSFLLINQTFDFKFDFIFSLLNRGWRFN